MIAKNLLSKLRHLVLAGKNEEGELEWIGTEKQWNRAQTEENLNEELTIEYLGK